VQATAHDGSQADGSGHRLTGPAQATRLPGRPGRGLPPGSPSAGALASRFGGTCHEPPQPANDPPVTLINVFEVPTEHVDAFIAGWAERAALMSTKPGFLDTRLHRALSPQTRFQLVNVARWETPEALHAATADPEFQQRISAAVADPQLPISANPALYQVAVEFPGPAPHQHHRTPPAR
jgi:heme-degrading monooxygenase HmoA